MKKLLHKARFTEFGQQYRFDEIVLQENPGKKIPGTGSSYSITIKFMKPGGIEHLKAYPDVCWPGKIKYYALSSGTSEAASKYIPVTNDLLKGNRIVMIRQILSLAQLQRYSYALNWQRLAYAWRQYCICKKAAVIMPAILVASLQKKFLSGFSHFINRVKKLHDNADWTRKLKEIVKKAPEWDIGFIVGVPAWIQMCMEMIIERI